MHFSYLFTSERLGFRNWQETDLMAMAAINADRAAMEFFPDVKTEQETADFILRMQRQYADKGYCYFAVDILETGQFIGFIGLSEQLFEAPFTPCIDIGWRLSRASWRHGYATEGANRCLQYAFVEIGISNVKSMAPVINVRSVQVMNKAGMQKVGNFVHPLLADDERLRDCVLYELNKQ
jgi:RimJ/RimL family protein N-acetyltransferase